MSRIVHDEGRASLLTMSVHGRVVVCVVSDGRTKINPRTLKVLGLYGACECSTLREVH